MSQQFLGESTAHKGTWHQPDASELGVTPRYYWRGNGTHALEVAHGTATTRPSNTNVRKLWKARHGNSAAPLLLVVAWPEDDLRRAAVCGPRGDDPVVVDLDLPQAERLAQAALEEPNRHNAARFVAGALQSGSDEAVGLLNRGLFATHELAEGVPARPDWTEAVERSKPLLAKRDHELIRDLGYTVDPSGQHHVLRAEGHSRAVAVFLQPSEQADQPSARHGGQTPVSYALAAADRDNLKWVVAVRGGNLRLYSTETAGAAGQRGRAETYTELNLPLLQTDRAGYLSLLFSPEALAPDGTASQVRTASQDYAAGLSQRLRDRVYTRAVPHLAVAVARERGGVTESDLALHYRTALTILFRVLFVAYAEDSRLLPLHSNGDYTDHALKTLARRLADHANAGEDLGFDNPLTSVVEPATDADSTELWDRAQQLFTAVDKGHVRWGVPQYNGGLFSNDPSANPVGGIIADLRLSNADFGPALMALMVDKTEDEVAGPIDFRSLSVREFGTIYEGLLESELSVAADDLTVDTEGTYRPAREGEDVLVEAGEIYLHNRSGARKASGSFFTKPFAVEHIIGQTVEPALQEHLARVAAKLAGGKEADAAAMLFDFRCADIAMGSAHFLTAVVDRLEATYTEFLTRHPIPRVMEELDTLRAAALEHLGNLADTVEIENSSLLRRMIARRCIYGVDLNPISVELARVSMWIHTFVPGLPLSFLDHNLVHGDSLTGIGTIHEATEELTADGVQPSLFDNPILEALDAARQPLQRLANLADATATDVQRAREASEAIADAIDPVSELFDLVVAARLGETEPPALTSLEKAPDLLSEVARQAVRLLRPIHFPVAFPEVFLRENPGFDVLVGNPPWEKPQVEEHEFWGRHFPGHRGLPQREKETATANYKVQRPDLLKALHLEQERTRRLRDVVTSGPYELGVGHADFAQLFAWRFWALAREGGHVGLVMPRSAVLSAPGMAVWRNEIFEKGAFNDVCLLLNNRYWVFDEVEPRYTIALLALQRLSSPAAQIRLRGPFRSFEDYRANTDRATSNVQVSELKSWGASAAFPLLPTPKSLQIYRSMAQHPRLQDITRFVMRPVQGDVNATEAKRRGLLEFSEAPPPDSWPVLGGSGFRLLEAETGQVYAWTDRSTMREHLFERRNRQARLQRSAFSALDSETLLDAETLPCMRPRIAFRDVARATDTRTIIVALVPPEVVLQHKAPFLLRTAGTQKDEAYLLGVLASIPLDWLARRLVETTVSFSVLGDLAIPLPDVAHPGYVQTVSVAGRLAAVDDRFKAWADAVEVPAASVSGSERDGLVAELDACVARLYGLTEDELVHVFETFHVGWDYKPRLEAVLTHFRTITWDPAPTEAA